MFTYDVQSFRQWLLKILQRSLADSAYQWLSDSLVAADVAMLQRAFVLAPRKTGKTLLHLNSEDLHTLSTFLPGTDLQQWPIDRVTRLRILLQFDEDSPNYRNALEQLFLAAEMSELVALYSALPFLPDPASWASRCAEGIRSNMAPVLEAIMYHNPYPKEFLPEPAWNQMIMKAIFTDKQLPLIDGLKERANSSLANIIIDFAHERWAAHRTLDPQVWQLVTPFLTEVSASDIRHAFDNGDQQTKKLLNSFLTQSTNPVAQQLVKELSSAEV